MKDKKIAVEEEEPRRSADVIDLAEALKRSLGKGGAEKMPVRRPRASRRAARRRHG